ncbi:MAG: thioesterase family protein [Marinibacterium sp.]|nr:thioesterase family protein [Marinibacterium sp.]
MTEPTLSQVFDAAAPDGDGLRFPAPANWKQGRTAYGGFTAALLAEGVRRQHDDLPPLRSALINFTAPVTDDPVVRSSVLRAGRNVTTISARADVGGAVAATATLSFGQAQPGGLQVDLPARAAPDPQDAPPFPQGAAALTPAFFGQFEVRVVDGHPPFSGAPEGVLRVWARHVDPQVRSGVPGVMAVADLLPPAVFPMLKRPAVNSSMTWIVNLLTDAPRTTDGWWLLENRLSAAGDGFSSQGMRVWNTDRQLVVDGMQSVIVFER